MNKIIRVTKLCFESLLLCFISIFIRRSPDHIAFGSWGGERYADNSRYLAEYIYDHFPKSHIVWVGKKEIREDVRKGIPNVDFAEIDTLIGNIKLLKCKYMFFSQMHNADISSYNVFYGATTCYLHHGMPIKKWGQDGLTQSIGNTNLLSKVFHRIIGEDIIYDYFVTSSPLHDKTNCSGLAYKGCNEKKNIHSGTPRNDMYFNVSSDQIIDTKIKYSKLLGFDSTKKVIMYLPTFRRTTTNVFSFSRLSEDQRNMLDDILDKHNCILIEKSHVAEKNIFNGESKGNVICAPSKMNVQEMMLFADILISDYSGAYLDFALLDRPIIHYAYDYDYYKNVDSGLYYEIEDFSAGPIVYEYGLLIRIMDDVLQGNDQFCNKRKYVRDKYMQYETGNASSIIVSSVMGGDIV